MKILFIGGTGILSTDIVKLCIRRKYDVYLLNRGHHSNDVPSNCHSIVGNIRDEEECKKLLAKYKFDVVGDFLSYTSSQIASTIRIIEGKCSQYIFVSSACSYRRDINDFPIKENSVQPNDNLPYGVNKFECENFLKSHTWSFKYTIVRPYITYGDTRIPFGIAPAGRCHGTIVKRILERKPLFYWNENGHIPICNLTHTTDFAVAFCGLMLNPKAYNEDFNIVGDEIVSWKEMIELLYEVVGVHDYKLINVYARDVSRVFMADKDFFLGDRNLDGIFDNEKIKKVVPEFQTTISLREGLSKTVAYYKANNYLGGIDYRYDALCDKLLSLYGEKTSFCNYNKSATLKQRVEYFLYRYLNNTFIKTMTVIKKLFN